MEGLESLVQRLVSDVEDWLKAGLIVDDGSVTDLLTNITVAMQSQVKPGKFSAEEVPIRDLADHLNQLSHQGYLLHDLLPLPETRRALVVMWRPAP